MRARAAVTSALALAGSLACDGPRTQMVVQLDTDMTQGPNGLLTHVRVTVRSAADVVDRYVARMRHLRHERFLTVLVDAKNRVLRDDVVGDGGLSSVPVHPREAFGPALREGASGVVFVHNHPSGDPEPSPVDDDLTRRLLAVGELLGIRVLDHIVIGDGRFVSYRDRGIVPPA
jgi:DNA repair protein RadC